MSTLTNEELAWVNSELQTYPIMYVEIYNEIADHVLSAIEAARAAGDERDIVVVFNEVMQTHFPGEKTVQKVVLKYVFAYQRKVMKMMWGNFKYYLNGQAVLAIALMLALGFYLPQSKTTALVFMGLLIVIAAVPSVYVVGKIPSLKKSKSKPVTGFRVGGPATHSLARTFVLSRSRNLIMLCVVNTSIVGFLAKRLHINFLNPLYYHPAFNMLLVAGFIIYGLSCMRLCRQQFKIAD